MSFNSCLVISPSPSLSILSKCSMILLSPASLASLLEIAPLPSASATFILSRISIPRSERLVRDALSSSPVISPLPSESICSKCVSSGPLASSTDIPPLASASKRAKTFLMLGGCLVDYIHSGNYCLNLNRCRKQKVSPVFYSDGQDT